MEGYRKSSMLFRFFLITAIFLLPVSPLRPPKRPFLLYFCPYIPAIGRPILDGTNGLSSSKPRAYCRIVRSKL